MKEELRRIEERLEKLNDELTEIRERVSRLEAMVNSKERWLVWIIRVLMLILLAKLGVTYGQ